MPAKRQGCRVASRARRNAVVARLAQTLGARMPGGSSNIGADIREFRAHFEAIYIEGTMRLLDEEGMFPAFLLTLTATEAVHIHEARNPVGINLDVRRVHGAFAAAAASYFEELGADATLRGNFQRRLEAADGGALQVRTAVEPWPDQ